MSAIFQVTDAHTGQVVYVNSALIIVIGEHLHDTDCHNNQNVGTPNECSLRTWIELRTENSIFEVSEPIETVLALWRTALDGTTA